MYNNSYTLYLLRSQVTTPNPVMILMKTNFNNNKSQRSHIYKVEIDLPECHVTPFLFFYNLVKAKYQSLKVTAIEEKKGRLFFI